MKVRFLFAFVASALVMAWVTGCPSNALISNAPPSDQFYFPTGMVHVDSAVAPDGVLFVANANFDKRFAAGSVIGINLSKVGLPKFGAPVTRGPVQLPLLNTNDAGIVLISSFAGEMTSLDLGAGRTRLFIPSRSEGMKFHAIDADPLASADSEPVLHCATPAGATASDCASGALSLSPPAFELGTTGLPRAPGPFGVASVLRTCARLACPASSVCVAGQCMVTTDAGLQEPLADVYVTHITQADTPLASGLSPRGYLVHLSSHAPEVTEASFINLGTGATSSVVVGQRYVYASGRGLNPTGNLLRLVDPDTIGADGGTFVLTSGIENAYRAVEGRGVALSSDEHRVYIAARLPDSLIVASVNDPTSLTPRIDVARTVPLPANPSEVRVIRRAGQSDLVVVTCSGAQSVVLYDDDVGNVVGQVNGVGLTPFGLAVDLRESGARLYVGDFDDGRIAVIDIPDLNRPQEARLVAHLGNQQLCLTQGQRNPELCDGGTVNSSLFDGGGP